MQSSSDILIPLFFVTVLSNHTEKVIDPKILRALDSKQVVQDALLEAVKAEIKDVKKEENV